MKWNEVGDKESWGLVLTFFTIMSAARLFFCIKEHLLTLMYLMLLKIEEEERKLETAIEETEKQCAVVTAELKELEMKSSRFKELEER